MSKRKPKDGHDPATAAAPSQLAERSVIDLILDIKEKRVLPKLLSPEDRRACVAHLGTEGMSIAEIAQFLSCSDRTIFRDRQALQEEAALRPDSNFAARVAGQVIAQAMMCMERISRIGRDRLTMPETRLDAWKACFSVYTEQIRLLQSLGYLPTAAQQVSAKLTHSIQDIPSMEVIQQEIKRLTVIMQTDGGLSTVDVQEVEALAARAVVAAELEAQAKAAREELSS